MSGTLKKIDYYFKRKLDILDEMNTNIDQNTRKKIKLEETNDLEITQRSENRNSELKKLTILKMEIYFGESEDIDKYVNIPLKKIISGGQTGADRGALEAAELLGFETGGTAPCEFWTTNGKCPELGYRFRLQELKMEKGSKTSVNVMYVTRSKKNIDNSDGTIAFRLHSSIGTDKSIGYCLTKKWECVVNTKNFVSTSYRPLLIINDISNEKKKENSKAILSFIFEHNVKILNVCGHREDKNTNFTSAVKNILIDALQCYRLK